MARVSVLMPTYNQANFIDASIQSAINQTYDDFELIVVDNCSTDQTAATVQKYLSDHRVKYLKNETNIGNINNFNKAVEFAGGEYVKYLFSDDLLLPTALEKFVGVMDSNPNVSLATSYFEHFGSLAFLHKPPLDGTISGYEAIKDTVITCRNWIGSPSNVMFRKADFDDVGFDKKWKYLTDLEFWHRLLLKGDLYVIPLNLTKFRHHQQSATTDCHTGYDNLHDAYYYLKHINDNDLYAPLKENEDFQTKLADNALLWVSRIPAFYRQKNYDYLKKAVREVFGENIKLKSAGKASERAVAKLKRFILANRG